MQNWTRKELKTLGRLTSAEKIQAFLDGLVYCGDDEYRSPRTVLKTRLACCLEGAALAAAALQLQGYPALLIDLRAIRDDDHVIAPFKRRGLWGAVSKSHFLGLRFRSPVYRTVRELVMSYFDSYYNDRREMTLVDYSRPVGIDGIGVPDWRFDDDSLRKIADRIDKRPHLAVLPRGIKRTLGRIDPMSARMHKIRE